MKMKYNNYRIRKMVKCTSCGFKYETDTNVYKHSQRIFGFTDLHMNIGDGVIFNRLIACPKCKVTLLLDKRIYDDIVGKDEEIRQLKSRIKILEDNLNSKPMRDLKSDEIKIERKE